MGLADVRDLELKVINSSTIAWFTSLTLLTL